LALVAPGGFLLVPVLVLHGGQGSGSWRDRVASLVQRVRGSVAQLQRYWTKS